MFYQETNIAMEHQHGKTMELNGPSNYRSSKL